MNDSCPDCHETAIRLLQMLTGSRDLPTAMRSECYLAVLNREPQSQTNIARKYGVTRAAVSKIICKIKDELGIGGKYGQEGLTYKERFAKLKEKL